LLIVIERDCVNVELTGAVRLELLVCAGTAALLAVLDEWNEIEFDRKDVVVVLLAVLLLLGVDLSAGLYK
jgi:hypothetical protein